MNSTKVVRRRAEPTTPQEFHRLGAQMDREIDVISPHARRREFIFKARTWEDMERWEQARRDQDPVDVAPPKGLPDRQR